AMARERVRVELDDFLEGRRHFGPAPQRRGGLTAQVMREHVARIARRGLAGEIGRLRVVLLVHRLDRLAVEGERPIVPRRRRARGLDGARRARARAEREAARGPVPPATPGPRGSSLWSSKRTGNVTHPATASFPRRAGSKRHVLTASTAARSRSTWPAE